MLNDFVFFLVGIVHQLLKTKEYRTNKSNDKHNKERVGGQEVDKVTEGIVVKYKEIVKTHDDPSFLLFRMGRGINAVGSMRKCQPIKEICLKAAAIDGKDGGNKRGRVPEMEKDGADAGDRGKNNTA